MNKTKIVSWANVVGMLAAVFLVYWVFIFLLNTIFDLKIFAKHLTTAFLTSILGLLALMASALIISLMLNITRIAASLEKLTSSLTNTTLVDGNTTRKLKLMITAGVAASFLVIAVLMFAGDAYSKYIKKQNLLNTAQALVQENQDRLTVIKDYDFNPKMVADLTRQMNTIAKMDSSVDQLSLLLPDKIDGRFAVLGFAGGNRTSWSASQEASTSPEKIDFIFSGSQSQRAYLKEVFLGKTTEYRFEVYEGNYELFYPVLINKKVVVFYFSDFQRYGKVSS
jgi:hypothetical protein